MIDFTSVQLEQVVIHQVGNRLRDEYLKISSGVVEIEDTETINYLLKYFLSSFNDNEIYNFTHSSEIELNEIYSFSKKIFANPDSFFEKSVDIAKHLYEKSIHPKVSAGELCVCYFKKCFLDGTSTDAIGLFKSEGKDVFLKFDSTKNSFKVRHERGIDIKKLDKGCLIFNVGKSSNYKVCITDSNKSNETQYWKNDFLNIKAASDNYHFTKDFLSITKVFVTKQLEEEFEVNKADKIDLLNRSVEYFKTHDSFEKKKFEKEVFQDSEIIRSFRKFDSNYRQENEIELADNFDISLQAVKKQERVFKSVLKLDKNFHIYIHGNREMIEQGIDKDGRKYYKIYYEQES